MIYGIGTDIVEIKRIQQMTDQYGDKFAQRILSPKELNIYHVHAQPVQYLAKRFAAKEAAAKALGIGIAQGLSFHQFSIMNDVLGKPCIGLSGQAEQLVSREGLQLHISLSDEKEHAVAFVIAEKQ